MRHYDTADKQPAGYWTTVQRKATTAQQDADGFLDFDHHPYPTDAVSGQLESMNTPQPYQPLQFKPLTTSLPEAEAENVENSTSDAPIQRMEAETGSESAPTPVAGNNTGPSGMANRTGLPDNLKVGVEALSGYAMDDVKVHYNSSKPAQLHAHAYAQGTDIHLAPGQEKHLPHETWHVVQQKQRRVKPTMQLKGKVNINDDKGLEREADVMGGKAFQFVERTQNNYAVQGDTHHKGANMGINAQSQADIFPGFKKVHKPNILLRSPLNTAETIIQGVFAYQQGDATGLGWNAQEIQGTSNYRGSAPAWNGTLAGDECEFTLRDAALLSNLNINKVISLNHGDCDGIRNLEIFNIQHHHIRTGDFTLSRLIDLTRIAMLLNQGNTFIHCGAGYGRTGTAIAYWQMSLMTDAQLQAIPDFNVFLEDLGVEAPNQRLFLTRFREEAINPAPAWGQQAGVWGQP